MNLILPELNEAAPYLRFSVEYADTDGTVALETRFNGSARHPVEAHAGELPAILVSRMTRDMTYARENGENVLRCYLK